MSTIIENKSKDFVAHPEGQFIAIARDTYLKTRPNPFKGQQRDRNDPSKGIDERDEITELVIEFLTDHEVEIDGKKMPGYVRYTATASVAENSNLRKFVQGWFPGLKEENFKRFDADALVGKGAYITVSHNVDKKGNVWANVKVAMQPPKTKDGQLATPLPVIPSDFVRKEERDKREQEEAQVKAAADSIRNDEPDESPLPF